MYTCTSLALSPKLLHSPCIPPSLGWVASPPAATSHPSSQLAQIAESEFLQLDPSAGSPWQRVDTEQGSYYFNPHTQVGDRDSFGGVSKPKLPKCAGLGVVSSQPCVTTLSTALLLSVPTESEKPRTSETITLELLGQGWLSLPALVHLGVLCL